MCQHINLHMLLQVSRKGARVDFVSVAITRTHKSGLSYIILLYFIVTVV